MFGDPLSSASSARPLILGFDRIRRRAFLPPEGGTVRRAVCRGGVEDPVIGGFIPLSL